MKKRYLFSFIVLLFVSVFALVACGEEPSNSGGDDKKEGAIKLDFTEASLKVGETKDVTATLENLEGTIEWSSSDSSVVSIENNVITAVGVGEATITAKLGDKTAEIKVTVEAAAKETFKVKFLDSDYTLIKEEVVEKGGSATAPVMTDTETKLFDKWDKDFTNVQSNLNVIAQYKNKYTITYNLDGGLNELEPKTSYFDGETFDLPVAHKAGCKFMGWEKSDAIGKYITKVDAGTKGDLTLKAKFVELETLSVTYNYNGGVSNELYVASADSAKACLVIDNYNAVKGGYWGGAYADYVFITNRANDPGATFSDRFYITLDSETGLYKVCSILLSGASSWPSEANYVITYSSSYKNHYTCHNEVGLKVEVGDYVVFDNDFTQIKKSGGLSQVNCYFFNTEPTATGVKRNVNTSIDKLLQPLRLGFLFKGWKDSFGYEIKTPADVYDGAILEAQWEERTPVTAISTNEVPTEMVTGDSFKITASVVPSDAYFKTINFSTSNRDIVSVDKNGNIVAKSAGTATITMIDYMKRVTVEKVINVYPIDCVDINFGNFNGILKVGETVELKPQAFGKDVSGLTFTYTSSDPTVLEVDANGKVTAKANGSAVITVKDSASTTHTLEYTITVDPLATTDRVDEVLKLIAEKNNATVEVGNVCLYNDGTERYYKATYGSVNAFLFAPYVVNRSNANDTLNPDGSPMARRFSGGFDDSIEFVTVHDTATLTGNPASTSASMNNSGTNSSATIHYVVGNNEIYQAVTERYIAYHAGDGTGTPFKWTKTNVKAPTSGTQYPAYDIVKTNNGYNYTINGQDSGIAVPSTPSGVDIRLSHLGPVWKIVDGYYYLGTVYYESGYRTVGSHGGNNNSIGIEMCVNTGGDIMDTWQRTAQLVADICVRNNLDTTRVKMHNTWTGKNCPQCIIAGNYWWNFIEMVDLNYTIMKNYNDATITMKSNNPNIVDNTGRILNGPSVTTTVSYDVTVKIGEVSKTMRLYSVVPGTTTWEQWNGSYPSSQIWNDGWYSKNNMIDLPYNYY